MWIFDKLKWLLKKDDKNQPNKKSEEDKKNSAESTSKVLSVEFVNELWKEWTKIDLWTFIGLWTSEDAIQIAQNTKSNKIEVINRSKWLSLNEWQKNFTLIENMQYIIWRNPKNNELWKQYEHRWNIHIPWKSSEYGKFYSWFSGTVSREHIAIKLENWNIYIKDLGSSNWTKYTNPIDEASKITPKR